MRRLRFLARVLSVATIAGVFLLLVGGAAAQTPPRTPPLPAPKPFPQPGQPAPPAPVTSLTPPSTGQAPPAPAGTPTEETLGVTIYPTAEFLGSFDAGRGQRLYLFGTNALFVDIVGYYKTIMRTGGREIFKAPATQEFDFPGVKFQEETMAFVPSVVVKDYTWGGSDGYLFIDGTKQKRFKTIIQIVPVK
jgi:hypothetical protein